jgi:archaellum component FlaF (FlaF/FlaG flagellin family)
MRALMLIRSMLVSVSAMAADATRLFDEIREANQKFFAALNACNLETMGKIFSKDLEFYLK